MLSDPFWKKLSYFAGLLAIGGICALLTLMANVEIKDLDLWLHLAMGRFIIENGYVPSVDVLSCTMAGKPWVNHEWLFQIIAYFSNQWGGADGLILLQVVVVLLTLTFLLLLGYNKENQLSTLIPLFLVLFVYRDRFTIRPDLFSLFFLTFFLYILFYHIHRRWALPVLFISQILWTNMHGFFILGPGLALVLVGSQWLKRHTRLLYEWNQVDRFTDQEYRRLQGILAVLILACLINPLGLEGAWYPLKILGHLSSESKIFFAKILELQKPVDWRHPLALTPYLHYKLLIVISFLSFFINRRKINLDLLLLWAVFLVFSLSAIRNLAYFAFMAYFVIFVNTSGLLAEQAALLKAVSAKMRHIFSLLIKIVIVLYLADYGTRLSYSGYYDFDTYQRKSEFGGVSLRNFPYRAVDFLVQNNIKGNFFNDFNSGAYLVGRAFPNIKVFIDGRTELYGAEFFDRQDLAWRGDKKVFDEIVEKYRIDGLFLGSVHAPIAQKLLWQVSQDAKWVPVYLDYDAVIFLRDAPQHAEVIQKHKIDLAHWKTKKMDLARVGLTNIKPYQNMHRAYSLATMGYQDAAFGEAYAAMKIMPTYDEPYKVMGDFYLKKGAYAKAFEVLRVAKLLDPRDAEVRYRLALFFEQQKDFKQALEQCQVSLAYKPGMPASLLLSARIQAKQEHDAAAMDIVRSIKRLTVFESDDLVSVGDVFYQRKKYDLAKEIYELALPLEKNLAQIHGKLALAYQGLGEEPLARQALEKAISLEPENPEFKNFLDELKE